MINDNGDLVPYRARINKPINRVGKNTTLAGMLPKCINFIVFLDEGVPFLSMFPHDIPTSSSFY